jgi:hypothetical protein
MLPQSQISTPGRLLPQLPQYIASAGMVPPHPQAISGKAEAGSSAALVVDA